MKSNLRYIYYAIISMSLLSLNAFADVKVKSRMATSGQSYESTTYIKGKRQRSDMMNGMMATITQCDLSQTVQLSQQTKTYTINPFNDGSVSKPTQAVASGQSAPVQKGGVVTTLYNVKDTGERKQMFGYTARHLIITMETESSPDACSLSKNKMEIDGWYIDFATDFRCENPNPASSYVAPSSKGGCRDRYEMKQTGNGKTGYPVLQTTKMFDTNGKETSTMTQEVLEISKSTLDQALFEIPADYREVKSAAEMYAASSPSSSGSSSNPGLPSVGGNNGGNNSGLSQNIKAQANQNSNVSTTVGAKKEGTVRVGLAGVKTGAIGEGITATDLAAAVQNTLGEFLKGTNVEIVPLEAKLSSAQEAEAREKECDFILQATVSHKKGGGGFGFGKVLGSVVSQTGIGHTGSTAGNIAGQIATQTIVAATMSQNMKSKDEITLDIKLNAPGSTTPALSKQYKQKAKSDGEDIISAVIEQAAQAIVDAVTPK